MEKSLQMKRLQMSKRYLTTQKPNPNQDQSANLPTPPQKVEIVNNPDSVVLKFTKEILQQTPTQELQQLFIGAIFPYLKIKSMDFSFTKDTTYARKIYPRIGVFIESKSHYTGGRYSAVMYAVLLSQFAEVCIVSDAVIHFKNDFIYYQNPRLKWIVDPQYCLNEKNKIFDLVIGVPNISGVYAQKYAEKFRTPLGMVIFETPNFIQKYRSGIDSTEEYWKSFKQSMFFANFFITPSQISKEHLLSWYNEFQKIPTYVISPNINELSAKSVIKSLANNPASGELSKPNVLFSSRMTEFKNPFSIITDLSKDYIVNVVGRVPPQIHSMWSNRINKNNIIFHDNISDNEKFKLFSQASVLIHPSLFEGFGMSLMEAKYFEVPIVCYDLPVFRENFGDYPNYISPVGDTKAFIQKVRKILQNTVNLPVNGIKPTLKEKVMGNHVWHMNFPIKKVGFLSPDDRFRIKGASRCLFQALNNIPKISVGMIAYDCEDYLKYAIDSVYDIVHQIIIVVGAVKGYAEKPDLSKLELLLRHIKDNDIWDKIEIVINDNLWHDKIAMQNQIAELVTGDYYVKIDPDEIWEPNTLIDAIATMEADKTIKALNMPFLHFWTSFNYIAKDAGGKWSTFHSRIWRWHPTMRHVNSFNHFHTEETPLKIQVNNRNFKFTAGEENQPIYHFGYVRTLDKIERKLNYYANRGIETDVRNTYATWTNLDDPTQPTQLVRSWAEVYNGNFPAVLRNHPYRFSNDVRKLKE